MRAFSACSPSNGPVASGPPKNAVPASRAVRIGVVALRVVAGAAVGAVAAADRRAGSTTRSPTSRLRTSSPSSSTTPTPSCPRIVPGFMPRHRAAHEVQVGAADRARGKAHDRIRRLLDRRLGDIVDADASDAWKAQPSCVRRSRGEIRQARLIAPSATSRRRVGRGCVPMPAPSSSSSTSPSSRPCPC